MKICIVGGAGAIGGFMGVKLALAGEDVTLIARGAKLDAVKKNGMKLIMNDGAVLVAKNIKATNCMSEVGPQDVVILAVKAHQIESIVEDIHTLFGPQTMVMTTQNGIPWWYFQKHGGEFEGRRITSVDPRGTIADNIEADRIIGCVVYPATDVPEPGVVRHIEGIRFPIGELDGSESERAKILSKTLINAGFKSPILQNVRAELWLKAWGNLSFNPISALTHSTLVDICQYPFTRDLAAKMMTEAQTVANKLNIEFRVPLEKRIAGAEKVGKHKTSMLQDIEIGRAIEADALIGAVIELGQLTQTPTPHLDTVYACVKLLDKTLQEEGTKVQAQRIPMLRQGAA